MSESRVVERIFAPAGKLGPSAQQWVEDGSPAGVTPRRAATVMLLRDAAEGVEVFMMRRVSTMAFAPSMWVFPGGGVDDRDSHVLPHWAGPSPAEWAQRLGEPEDVATALVVAAAREVFEESGVLLAGRGDDALVTPDEHPERAADRAALLAREVSFAELLAQRGMTLRTDLLQAQDHWITPEFEPRRYDTWFFAALMPADQHADDDTTESDVSRWVRPAQLLADLRAGDAVMLPPTELQLERIGRAPDANSMVEHRPPLMTVMPVPEMGPDGVQLRVSYFD